MVLFHNKDRVDRNVSEPVNVHSKLSMLSATMRAMEGVLSLDNNVIFCLFMYDTQCKLALYFFDKVITYAMPKLINEPYNLGVIAKCFHNSS